MTDKVASGEYKSWESDGNDDAWRQNVRGVESAMHDMLSKTKSDKQTRIGLVERLRAAIGFKRNVPPSRR